MGDGLAAAASLRDCPEVPTLGPYGAGVAGTGVGASVILGEPR